MLQEQWRPVVGYEGRYEVSNFGQVKSLSKMGGRKMLRTAPGRKGYPECSLYGAGGKQSRKTHRVHNLVAAAFLGPRPAGRHVRHLDGDSAKPWSFNLAYGTPQENLDDMLRHGTHPSQQNRSRTR